MNYTVDDNEVRNVLTQALGDDRLSGVEPDTPLLRSGIITSIELVSVELELEKHFGQPGLTRDIAPGEVSIRTIVAALRGAAPSPKEAAGDSEGNALRGVGVLVRKPLLALILVVAFFFAIDHGVALFIQFVIPDKYDNFLEHGRRLYPIGGGLSQDDFRFAFEHHEVNTHPTPDRRLIVVFGDSGTIGSYVSAEESIPAQAEAALERSGVHARVANFAWFGRSLVKDVMLLDLAVKLPLDTVVFTIGKDYFTARQVDIWLNVQRHISFNRLLFTEFRERIPADQQAPFLNVEERLRRADRANLGPLRRLEFALLATSHYAPYVSETVGDVLEGWIPKPDHQLERDLRYFMGQQPAPMDDGIVPSEVDTIQIEMLKNTSRLLRQQGISVLLYLEPVGPAEWMQPATNPTTALIAAGIAKETGASVVDLTWALHREDFLDSPAHYRVEANKVLGEHIAAALARKDAEHVP